MKRQYGLLRSLALLLWATLPTGGLCHPLTKIQEEEEVLVLVSVDRIGHFEINALITGQQIKLPVVKLLTAIKIKYQWAAPDGTLQIF